MSLTEIENNNYLPNSILSSQYFNGFIDLERYDLFKEEDRLASFINNGWSDTFVSAIDLARLGFYFLKKPDGVKCSFCHVSIGEFEEGDTALSEHIKWSPNCPLIRRRNTENVPIDNVLLDQTLPPPSYDICGFSSKRQKSKIEERIKHPEFRLISQRIKSFETWPVGIKQKPLELAEAGFFYRGNSDLTICFSCGVHLSKWEPTDNPWVEHKKHTTGECDFLELNHETVKLNEEKYEEFKKLPKNEIDSTKGSESQIEEVNFESACKICLERKSSILFLPCKHVAVCGQCVFGIENDCPICRTPIDNRVNFFYA